MIALAQHPPPWSAAGAGAGWPKPIDPAVGALHSFSQKFRQGNRWSTAPEGTRGGPKGRLVEGQVISERGPLREGKRNDIPVNKRRTGSPSSLRSVAAAVSGCATNTTAIPELPQRPGSRGETRRPGFCAACRLTPICRARPWRILLREHVLTPSPAFR